MISTGWQRFGSIALLVALLPMLVPPGVGLYVCIHDHSFQVHADHLDGCCPPGETPECSAGAACCGSAPREPERPQQRSDGCDCCIQIGAFEEEPCSNPCPSERVEVAVNRSERPRAEQPLPPVLDSRHPSLFSRGEPPGAAFLPPLLI